MMSRLICETSNVSSLWNLLICSRIPTPLISVLQSSPYRMPSCWSLAMSRDSFLSAIPGWMLNSTWGQKPQDMDHTPQENGRVWFLPRQGRKMVPEAFHCSLMNRAGHVVLTQPLLSPWASNTGTLMNDPLWQPSPAAGRARHGLAARPHGSSHCYLFPTFILVNQWAVCCCFWASLLY